MPSQVMAVVPVIMNSLHKDVMRGRKEVSVMDVLPCVEKSVIKCLANMHR